MPSFVHGGIMLKCVLYAVDCWIGPQMPHGSNVLINVPTVGFTPFLLPPLLPGVIPLGNMLILQSAAQYDYL